MKLPVAVALLVSSFVLLTVFSCGGNGKGSELAEQCSADETMCSEAPPAQVSKQELIAFGSSELVRLKEIQTELKTEGLDLTGQTSSVDFKSMTPDRKNKIQVLLTEFAMKGSSVQGMIAKGDFPLNSANGIADLDKEVQLSKDLYTASKAP